ncbi:carboxy terminal-processing peptidase [Chondrinema litorale]|uniref:carboxy terminal-processing peptidase n=1 Tax=Chondrinema litorale TaxID=2994555 RepID=UPI002542CD2D|nr:carboxy terminal-processing peptidase [Chondrinema litorale]UZR93681.1 carboxy terminal-processing peptidase [Chondrinema litorale]
MKKRILFLIIPAFIIALFSFTFFQADMLDKNKEAILKEIVFQGLIERAHFNNLTEDDEFSKKAFDAYLKRMDGGKRFFIKDDIKKLKSFETQIDDDIKGANNDLLTLSVSIMKERVTEAQAYCSEILEKPFDFDSKDEIELDSDKREYASSKKALKKEWEKYLRYQALVMFHNKKESQEKKQKEAKKKGEKFTAKTDDELEVEVRKDVKRNCDNLFDRLQKLDDEDKLSDYINAILSIYGPHTEFYPPYEKEEFDIQMSGRLEGIGAQLVQMDGSIKVSRIVPGSASWKQGDLKEEDIILKVAQAEEEPVSVEEMPLKDAVSLIRGKKGTEVRLTIKKTDGRIMIVPIIRDVVILEESYAKSTVIESKDSGHRIGYILLPSFYADFQRRGGRNSAEDVKKELLKLKEKSVDGIILDLRSNGGGSLRDAVDMSGLFIEKGPIVQVRSKVAKPVIYRDTDPEVIYDGPLVVMVNKISASASEILAAALQDYGRAVIVGSSSSFGKGTVQQFLELDNYLSARYNDMKPLGSLKLTIQKFYRITGKSTQWKGVTPDVILPDVYDFLEVGESKLDYALPWDEVEANEFAIWEKPLHTDLLAAKSEKRVDANEVFQLIEEKAHSMKEERDNTLQTLNYKDFDAYQDRLDEKAKKFSNLTKDHENLVLEEVKAEFDGSPDSVRVARIEDFHKKVQKDVYIYEALQVIEDQMKADVAVADPDPKKED